LSVGEEADGIDITLVTSERLGNLSASNVPQLGSAVAGTRNETLGIRREGNAARLGRKDAQHIPHYIAIVFSKFPNLNTSLNIPQNARHISRAGQDLFVVDETATRKVSSMCVKFATHSNWQFGAL
jgi:hypothetical protein